MVRTAMPMMARGMAMLRGGSNRCIRPAATGTTAIAVLMVEPVGATPCASYRLSRDFQQMGLIGRHVLVRTLVLYRSDSAPHHPCSSSGLCGLEMVGKHVVDDESRRACRKGVGAGEGGEGDESLPQGPATASRPGRVVERKRCPESLPALPGEERPGDRQIAGGITDAGAAEVDHGAQLAVPYQEVPGGDVAVDPDR